VGREKKGQGYRENEDIACQIEDQVHDEMVQRRRALRVVGWGLPVIMKWSTPDCEVEDLHNDVGDHDVRCSTFDNHSLSQILCKAPIEQQQTYFCSPLYRAHALLDEKHGFGTPCSFVDFVWCQVDRMGGINEIGGYSQVDVQEYDEDGVQAGQKDHQKVLHLQS